MEKFGKSQSTQRVEDIRFLTGHGRYVDDIVPEGALFAYALRATEAHADISFLDCEAARAAQGVACVLTLKDLDTDGVDVAMDTTLITNRDGSQAAAPVRPMMSDGRVRFVGEIIAMVVADTFQAAQDAAELIEVEYNSRTPHAVLEIGGAQIHKEAPDNVVFDWGLGDQAACETAFASAAHVVRCEMEDNRIIANSMEPRGCYAQMEKGRLHVCVNGQGVWGTKSGLAQKLNMDAADIRVTNPDVGGGFGMKAMEYPETFIVAYAARKLGQPVRWMADRSEAHLSDNAGRDLNSVVELAFDADHKIIAYRVRSLCNMGAYNSEYAQPIQTELFAKVLTGCYDIQTTWLNQVGIYTNTTQVDAYRGAGRPEAMFVLERAMDYAALQLGVDPWELRRKNFIPTARFPYETATGETYDVGDFHRVLDRVEIECDRAGFEARKQHSASTGKLRGIGLCYYIESILGAPAEDAKITFDPDGGVSIFVGTQSNGQGHETVYAQFLSDQTGIPAERITVVQGDSDLIERGGGTGGSRSVTVQNSATLATVEKMVDAFSMFLADVEGVEIAAIRFDHENFRIEGSNLTPTFLDVADMIRAAGQDDLLSHSARAVLDARSFPNGAHVVEVEIDPDTGKTDVVKYTVTDDFGNLINPMLAEGQVHGGVAQGVGQAITERVVYDDNGQLLSASFMDYAMPRADDMPMIHFTTEAVPSTANVMGMKGCGEAGTVGALAAVSNAVLNAVADHGVDRIDMPFTPERVWTALNGAKSAP